MFDSAMHKTAKMYSPHMCVPVNKAFVCSTQYTWTVRSWLFCDELDAIAAAVFAFSCCAALVMVIGQRVWRIVLCLTQESVRVAAVLVRQVNAGALGCNMQQSVCACRGRGGSRPDCVTWLVGNSRWGIVQLVCMQPPQPEPSGSSLLPPLSARGAAASLLLAGCSCFAVVAVQPHTATHMCRVRFAAHNAGPADVTLFTPFLGAVVNAQA